jgi:ATP-dependent RNA helicase RhlE
MSFSDFGLHPDLLRAIAENGFSQPTPIQRDALPPALAGRDVLACAQTGSGKTAAFVLPILQRLHGGPGGPLGPVGSTRALVLSPTRELAAQTVEHLEALARHTQVRAAAVFGGVGAAPQEEAFRAGVEVLVATPGRLLDHFQYPYARLEGLEFLVLDEADRMLDMGFLPDIRRVLEHLPPTRRQTLLFSATLPEPIVALARELLSDPVTINVERPAAPAPGITHAVYPVREELKRFLLLELLRRGAIQSTIVFTRTKHRANRLADFLVKHGIRCERLHGNRSQRQRTEALAGFKAGSVRVLVATDLAARGLDVEALSHVVNFDVPKVPDDYIHRVGRTARAEATGDAWTLVSEADLGDLRAIEAAIDRDLPRLELEGFDYTAAPPETLEIPVQDRIAALRARRAEERSRGRERRERREAQEAQRRAAPPQPRSEAQTRGEAQPRSEQPPRSDPPAPRLEAGQDREEVNGNVAGAHLASHLGPLFSSDPAARRRALARGGPGGRHRSGRRGPSGKGQGADGNSIAPGRRWRQR